MVKEIQSCLLLRDELVDHERYLQGREAILMERAAAIEFARNNPAHQAEILEYLRRGGSAHSKLMSFMEACTHKAPSEVQSKEISMSEQVKNLKLLAIESSKISDLFEKIELGRKEIKISLAHALKLDPKDSVTEAAFQRFILPSVPGGSGSA